MWIYRAGGSRFTLRPGICALIVMWTVLLYILFTTSILFLAFRASHRFLFSHEPWGQRIVIVSLSHPDVVINMSLNLFTSNNWRPIIFPPLKNIMSKNGEIFRQQWLVTQIDQIWARAERERRSNKSDSGSSLDIGENTQRFADSLLFTRGRSEAWCDINAMISHLSHQKSVWYIILTSQEGGLAFDVSQVTLRLDYRHRSLDWPIQSETRCGDNEPMRGQGCHDNKPHDAAAG